MRFTCDTAHGQCTAEVTLSTRIATVIAQCRDPLGRGDVAVRYVIGSPFPDGSPEEIAEYMALLAFSHMDKTAKVMATRLTFGPGEIAPNNDLQVLAVDSED
jgi:hypothetical protein